MHVGHLFFLWAGLTLAADKPALVREVFALNAYPSDKNEGPFAGPKRIETAEELAEHVSDKVWKARFEQNVDLATESLVLFEWYGSKFDGLTAAETKDATGPLVTFQYEKRKIATRADGKGFVRAFAVPKKTRLTVDTQD